MSITKILKEIYYDAGHVAGFGSAKDLYSAVRRKGKKITLKKVKEFLQKQDTYTLHKPVRRKFKRRKIMSKGVDYLWQADLIDLQPISKENKGNRFLLTIIDTLSRFGFAVPVKDKTGQTMVQAFKKIFSSSKRVPTKLFTDSGPEFWNKKCHDFLRGKNIIHYSTASDVKAATVERFNRTIQMKLYKYFTAKGTLHYVRVLPSLIRSYNERIHRAYGKAPVNVGRNNEKDVWQALYGNYMRSKTKLPKYK